MKIRPLESRDIKQVVAVWTSSFSRNFDNPVYTNYLNDPNSITLVMSDDKTILGVASLHIIKKLTRTLGLIEDVAVSNKYRGLGIGKKLVEKLNRFMDNREKQNDFIESKITDITHTLNNSQSVETRKHKKSINEIFNFINSI